ncbi:MAG: 6-bladed beta-propeller [Candidatus Aegiribacteria sp.]|nr:6-bladed beta-propeller [Candidatus Aegiribacteria sp.]
MGVVLCSLTDLIPKGGNCLYMNITRICLISLFSVFIACSSEQQDEGYATAPFDTLSIVDTIGMMYGDSNYVFGSISDVDRDQDGSICVLDRKRHCILLYSQSGEFIRQIGRYGEGPGEFNEPAVLVVTGDGSMLVNGMLWSRFGEELEFLDSEPISGYTIMEMESYGDDSIIGVLNYLDVVSGGMSVDRRIAMWSEFNPESLLTVFYQVDHVANVPQDIIAIDRYHYVEFTVIDELIYVAPQPLTEPLIVRYDEEGNSLDTLLLPYQTVPKTDEDMTEEKSFIEGNLSHNTSGRMSIDWEPHPNRAMITELGTDSLGRLWVQRGFEEIATFDIIDPGNLEIVETAVIPEIDDLLHWEFNISEHGLLGITEYDYPVIYIIE